MDEYTQIAPLVAQRQVEGRRVRVRFMCPETHYSVEAVASLNKANTAGQRMKDGFKRSFVNEARNVVSSALGNVLGRGMMGRMARQATSEAGRAAHGAMAFSESDVQRAVVQAFRSVQHSFTRAPTGQWVHTSARGSQGLPGLGSFGGAGGLTSGLGGGGAGLGGALAQVMGGGGANPLSQVMGGAGANPLSQVMGGGRTGGSGSGWGTMAAAAGAGALGGGLAGLVGGGLANLFGKKGGASSQNSGWSRIPGQQPPQQPAAQSGWSRIPGQQPPQQPAAQSGWSRIPGQPPQTPAAQAPAPGTWPQAATPPQATPAQAWTPAPPALAGYAQPGCGGQAEFDTVLNMHRPQNPQDRVLLTRMLVDLARVDGNFDPQENQYLGQKLAGADLRKIASQPPLTSADLGRLSPQVRPSALLLAHAMAFADGSLSSAEKTLLAQLERITGLPQEQTSYLRRLARGTIVERLLHQIYGDGHKTVEEAVALERAAIDLDVSSAELQRLDTAYRQRRGL